MTTGPINSAPDPKTAVMNRKKIKIWHVGSIGLLACLLFLLTPPQPLQANTDPRFGIIETYESPTAARQSGAGWTRVRFQWAEVQADGPDSWTPTVTERQIDEEVAAGRLVVGLLIGIPDWARDGSRLPIGLALPHNDPDNLWAAFVREAVTRYQGRIDHWIIWNEPDIWDASAPGHTWDGTEADFLQLQRSAYLTAKETNPNATIHLAAMTYFWDAQFGREQYLDRFFQVLTADPQAEANNYYFDIMTAHLYFQPNLIYDVITEFDQIRRDNGLPYKPIWLVETNAPPINDPRWPVEAWTLSVWLDEQAAFMPQVLASALAAGAERVAVYKLRDTADDRQANPEPFGLLRLDGSPRPAFSTYQVAVQYLSEFITVRRQRWNEVGQIWLTQPGRTTTVLFSRLPSPQRAEVEAIGETAVLVDMWGEREELTARNGVFTIDLPPAHCTQPIGDYCMIGGATYYLVQAGDGGDPPPAPFAPGDPTSTPDPSLPTNTLPATNTPPPTNTTTPAPLPTAANTASPTAVPTETVSQPPTSTMSPTSIPTPAVSPEPTLVTDTGGGFLLDSYPVGGLLAAAVIALFLVAGFVLLLRRRTSS